MFCEKCGAEIEDNSVFCEKCGEKNKAGISQRQALGNTIGQIQSQQEEIVFGAEKATAYRNFLIVIAVVTALLGLVVLPIVRISVENKYSEMILEAKYSSIDSYYNISRLQDEIDRVRPAFDTAMLIFAVLAITDVINVIINGIKIHRTVLYCTDLGVIGDTGGFTGVTFLHVTFSQIRNTSAKRWIFGSGWITFETVWGVQYTFFIKNPHVFLYYYNMQRYYPMTSTTPRFEPSAPKLTQKEKNIIIVTGLIYVISGVLTAVMLLNPGSMTQLLPMEGAESMITVSAFLGFCVSTFFGVAAILNKRWAFLTIRVFMILGIVFNVISVLYFFIKVKNATDSIPPYLASQIQVDYSPLLITFLSIGYEVLMIVFTSMCAKVLSQEVQYYRDKINHKK